MTELRLAMLISVFAYGSHALVSQENASYCAFEVVVKSSAGKAVKGVAVYELMQDGKTVGTATTDQQGVARICDAPAGLVQIQVGHNLCGEVTVRHLKPYWMQTRKVSIYYDNCSGEEWAVPGGCLLTIRIKDERGLPIAGVLFDTPNESPQLQTKISDEFGRIFRFIKPGGVLSAQLKKGGFLTQDIKEACQPGDRPDEERVVTLQQLNSTGHRKN